MPAIVPFLLVAVGAWLMYRRHRLSPHFTLGELSKTSTGLANVPTAEAVRNLRRVALEVLEPIRAAIGGPLYVSSGYRSPAVNAAVGGRADSFHLRGLGVDLPPQGGRSTAQLAAIVRGLNLPNVDVVDEGDHVHLEIDE